jgi:hypothetical protein
MWRQPLVMRHHDGLVDEVRHARQLHILLDDARHNRAGCTCHACTTLQQQATHSSRASSGSSLPNSSVDRGPLCSASMTSLMCACWAARLRLHSDAAQQEQQGRAGGCGSSCGGTVTSSEARSGRERRVTLLNAIMAAGSADGWSSIREGGVWAVCEHHHRCVNRRVAPRLSASII